MNNPSRRGRTSRPAAIKARPRTQTRTTLRCPASRGAITRALGVSARAIGIRLTAASRGLLPRTSWKYWRTRKTSSPAHRRPCITRPRCSRVQDARPSRRRRWRKRLSESLDKDQPATIKVPGEPPKHPYRKDGPTCGASAAGCISVEWVAGRRCCTACPSQGHYKAKAAGAGIAASDYER